MNDAVKPAKGESTRLPYVIGILLFIALGLLFLNFAIVGRNDAFDKQYIGLAGELQVLSQRIAKNATEASLGRVQTLALLKEARDRFAADLDALENGSSAMGLPPSPPAVAPALSAVEERWTEMAQSADLILDRSQEIIALQELAQGLRQVLPRVLSLSDELVTILVEQGADPHLINVAGRQRMLSQRIADNVNRAMQGGEGAVSAADRFGRDAALFGRVLEAMRAGDDLMQVRSVRGEEALAKLGELDAAYAEMASLVDSILKKSIELFQVQDAANEIFQVSEFLLDDTAALVQAYSGLASTRLPNEKTGLAVGAIALALLLWLGFSLLGVQRRRARVVEKARAEAERRRQEADEQNRRNQEAILRLLDEITDLAEGDLTVRATVTEDFTGAIADSINYAIDALRDLVTAINSTTQQVSSAAQETQATAMHLAEASEHQAQQISTAGASSNSMASAMTAAAAQAERSAEVAQRSVETAKRGSQAVRDTISAMDQIREQIQETSKRIKRLGESSQEIGEIVGLINDIADQTNILALNAAIQAAMAGEAGRGFAVVADEVQRLAERVGNATKQIDALVKTIQSDTNEAVSSMEESTSGVVKGAHLTEGAGKSLEEIESVSGDLARLINDLAATAQDQSQSAERISETMNVIQEITTQTSAGTNETAGSIGHLANLANELRKSVAGFKLPN
jgi:twitching motility protein PilJ